MIKYANIQTRPQKRLLRLTIRNWLTERVSKLPSEKFDVRRPLIVCLLQVACICMMIQGITNAQDDHEKKRGGPQHPTTLEFRSLPPACMANWKFYRGELDKEEEKKWAGILNGAFYSLHHYCNGLNFLNRINRGVGNKQTLLGAALAEFRYMQGIPIDNVLRPEVEFNIGRVLYMMDQIPAAIVQLRKAIQLKPDYEQAYLLLGICFRRLGDLTRAEQAFQEGLAKMPDSRALREALEWVKKENSEGR